MDKKKILIADDDKVFCNLMQSIISKKKQYKVSFTLDKLETKNKLNSSKYDIIFLDLHYPSAEDGFEILNYCKENFPDLPVVMISNDPYLKGVIKAIKEGAYDFIKKPIDEERVFVTLENTIAQNDLKKKFLQTQKKAIGLIGDSPLIDKIKKKIITAASNDFPVLLTGKTGTGKEIAAEAIHKLSNRSDNELIKINCSAIPSELLESELFGYQKGAFTGAQESKKGIFEYANNSSILLDEIGDLPLRIQPKLLRVLETGEIQTLGSKSKHINVRIISATNRKIGNNQDNSFRKDLLYRLNVLEINLPPLCNHKQDIPVLAKHFLFELCNKYSIKHKELTNNAIEVLLNYNWPGNVRELKNVISRSIVNSTLPKITSEIVKKAINKNISEANNSITLKKAKENFEKDFILKKLISNNWNVKKTALKLNIDKSNLYKKIKKHQVMLPE